MKRYLSLRNVPTPIVTIAVAVVSLLVLGAVTPQDPKRALSDTSKQKAPPNAPDGAPPGGPPFEGGPPPGGFGPGGFLAPALLEAADANEDGKLTAEEAAGAASKLVNEGSLDKKGELDARAFSRLLNKRFGPPPEFAPPGGGDADFGPGTFYGPQVFKAADANNDGQLSAQEAANAARGFVEKLVKEGETSIDSEALARAIDAKIGTPPGFNPGGPGGGPGPGGRPGGPGFGPFGMMNEERKLLAKFDTNEDGHLDKQERTVARAELKKESGNNRRGFGPPGGGMPFGRQETKTGPGPKVNPADVPSYPDKSLYDPNVLRTLFLEFESEDWETELSDFHKSDVEIPATLLVDGKTYPGVGVHFRGMSSYMMVPAGAKRSLNVSLDFIDSKQRIDGYKTLNLLNSHEDPTFLHTILYFDIARNYIPAPKANFVNVVINGESWGLYVNAQQFDKKFLAENYPSDKGARWKVPGSPGARGGLEYIGENIEDYKRSYELKTKDDEADWKALVALCRTLSETPLEQLEQALEPILDIDGALWFLALDNALVNNDGYWVRGSDYALYRDTRGKFHVIPHDANETFGNAMMGFGPGFGGPGGFGRPGRPGANEKGAAPAKKAAGAPGLAMRPGGPNAPLEPMHGLQDASKPLRSRLLAVPALRARYLDHVATIARDWLDWERLGPLVAKYRTLIDHAVEADTRKLSSYEEFKNSVADQPAKAEVAEGGPRPRFGPSPIPLRTFADERRKFLQNHADLKQKAAP